MSKVASLFGGAQSANRSLVREQRRQAEEAERKAEELKARRDAARGQIEAVYGGIGDDFYDAFRQQAMAVSEPALTDQYGAARTQALYDFARRGTPFSTAYIGRTADLRQAYDQALGDLFLQADQQTADLKNRTAREKQGALELASMAEDPTVATNRALTEVNAIQNASPSRTLLGDVFQIGATTYNAYQDARNRQLYRSMVPSANPYRSAGRVVS